MGLSDAHETAAEAAKDLEDRVDALTARVAAMEKVLEGGQPDPEDPLPEPSPEPGPSRAAPWTEFRPEWDAFRVWIAFRIGIGHDHYTVAAMIANGRPVRGHVFEGRYPVEGTFERSLTLPAKTRFLRIAARDIHGTMIEHRDFPVPWAVPVEEEEPETPDPEPPTTPQPVVAPPTLTKVGEGLTHADVRIDAPGADSIEYETP